MGTEKYALYIGAAVDILDIKTANGFRHWRAEDCVAEIALPGSAVSTGLPRLGLSEAYEIGARRLLIGITPHGGTVGLEDVPVILEALQKGYSIVSGLHAKMKDIPEIRSDPRYSPERVVELRDVGHAVVGTGQKRTGRRLLTVGTDCCVGKMFTSLSIQTELAKLGIAATFRATGQTGIMIAGEGVCVDAVVSDFIAGNVELLSPDNDPDHWDIIEGQGSLFHPAYAGVALGLLHGAQADALVVCHEWGRTVVDGTRNYPVPSLKETIELNLRFARMTNPSARVIGISINTRRLDDATAKAVCEKTERELGLPCVDVLRHGTSRLVADIIGDSADQGGVLNA